MYESATLSSASSTPSLLDDLAVLDLAAVGGAVVVDRPFEVVDGDGDVVDLGQQHARIVPAKIRKEVCERLLSDISVGVTELETHQITDAREMRALAHPLRLRLIGLLRIDGPATASALADHSGRHPGARELPPAPTRAVRVRRRGPGTRTRRTRALVARRAGAHVVGQRRIPRHARPHCRAVVAPPGAVPGVPGAGSSEHLHDVAALDADWVAATNHSDYILELDADGLRALNAELDALVERYRTDPPPAAAPTKTITVIVHSFPRPPGL